MYVEMLFTFSFFSFFLLLIVPGFIAAMIHRTVCKVRFYRYYSFTSCALIYDLLILIINFIGLFHFKGIKTINRLIEAFECLQFTAKYGLLAIGVGAVLALIYCAIRCLYKKFCH